jgi:hypothetical protein
MTKPKLRPMFADGTDVPVERSRAELDALLAKHGATSIAMLRDDYGTLVVFEMNGRRIRQQVLNPDPKAFETSPGKVTRSQAQAAAAVQQELKRRWRALLLIVKAKLEVVASGASTFEAEWLSAVMLPNGQTVGEAIAPHLERSYKTGEMPPLMLGAGK